MLRDIRRHCYCSCCVAAVCWFRHTPSTSSFCHSCRTTFGNNAHKFRSLVQCFQHAHRTHRIEYWIDYTDGKGFWLGHGYIIMILLEGVRSLNLRKISVLLRVVVTLPYFTSTHNDCLFAPCKYSSLLTGYFLTYLLTYFYFRSRTYRLLLFVKP